MSVDLSRLGRIATGLLTFVGFGCLGTLVIVGLCGAMHLAAMAAYWGDPLMPPFPWFLLRFFVAFVWIISAVGGLLAAIATEAQRAETAKQGSVHEGAGPEGIAQ